MSTADQDAPGFFIPYRYAADIVPCAYPALVPIFQAAEPRMLAALSTAEQYSDGLEMAGPPPLPRFDQEWFARLDAVAAYSFVRSLAPKRIVEIGSGHSTRSASRCPSPTAG